MQLPGYAANPKLYTPVKWIAPKWEWVDPLKDRQAEKIAQDAGWKAPSDIIEAEGYDVDETYRRIAFDQKRREELGIKLTEENPPAAKVDPEQTDDNPEKKPEEEKEEQE